MADNSSVKDILKDIQKKFGDVVAVGVDDIRATGTLSLGSPGLDYCLYNSLPTKRIIELSGAEGSGKTSLAFMMCAGFQRKELEDNPTNPRSILYVDLECTVDPSWAERMGYDMSETAKVPTICFRPEDMNGEQVLTYVREFIKSGEIGMIVIDSLPYLVSQQVYEESFEKKEMGGIAKLLKDFVTRITGLLVKYDCTVIGINQVRENIGGYGCLHADTVIPFTDGSHHTIRDIVDNKLQGKVWSLNEKTGEYTESKILDWHYNGKVSSEKDYIFIKSLTFDSSNGFSGITVTPDHLIMTKEGWKKAKDLTIKDKLQSKYLSVFGGDSMRFLCGCMSGDLSLESKRPNVAAIRIQDNENVPYMRWKAEKLNSVLGTIKKYHTKGLEYYLSSPSSELSELWKLFENRNPLYWLTNDFNWMSMAIWYMDDGSFDSSDYHYRANISVKRFKGNKEILDRISNALTTNGMGNSVDYVRGSISFSSSGTRVLFNNISKYVFDTMQYKLGEEYRGKFSDYDISPSPSIKCGYVDIVEIRQASKRQIRQKGKYDLTIEGTHNYVAGSVSGGVLVHNSPILTPGGRGWKHACAVRLMLKKGSFIDEEGNALNNSAESPAGYIMEAAVLKTKVCKWDRKVGRTYINYTTGVDILQDTIEVATYLGLIDNSVQGTFKLIDPYTGEILTDDKGNEIKIRGKKNLKPYFEEHKDLWKKLYDKVYEEISKKEDPHIISFEQMLGISNVSEHFGVNANEEEQ